MLPPTARRVLPRLPLPLAFVFALTAGAGRAAAQTVVITHAPPGGAVELLFNADRVQTGTADQSGEATLPFGLPAGITEADVRVSTERCGDTRRVLLVERGLQAPPPNGPCDRRDVSGFFIVTNVTSFVIDLQNPDPVVHLRQGPVPPAWLEHPGAPISEGHNLPPAPKGLMVFAGAGLMYSTNASSTACGGATQCSPTNVVGALSAGAGYWISHIIGMQAAYTRTGTVTDFGSDTGYHFSSARKADLFTISGMAGVPLGGFRLYGRGGANYSRADLVTSETIDISGTQNFELKTTGWGWQGAAGLEVWVKPFLGFYVEGGVEKLKGTAVGGGEGTLDDQLIFVIAGARLSLWR